MFTRISIAAIAAAALSGVIANSTASAQSYGGAPNCDYGQAYDTDSGRCVRTGAIGHRRSVTRHRPWVGYDQ
jgi:hypothetical protein